MKTSPSAYLANPPFVIRWNICTPRVVVQESIIGQQTFGTYVVPEFCDHIRRHLCGAQARGHDPGDEDAIDP